ncbi:RNA-binding domain-containing protein [uncultured Megasphaera sp.]|uniref:RNA-binding domain-containing protein n=1 Tax=uncultured Megasphaera sp. TaxID=165188 RepID=UPI00265A958A|nr:RNA-binding domain-containing protein [uncultured Megasphaera sp.]
MFPSKETMTIEFKSDRKCLSENVLIDAVVGMANAEGGTLYLGIEDNGDVTGVHPNHKQPMHMTALIADRTVPPVSVRAEILCDEQNPPVLKFEIPRSYAIVATRSGKILRRRLNSKGDPENLPMYPYEISSRLSELGMYDMSAQPLAGAVLEDFDSNEIVRLRQLIIKQRGEQALLQLNDEDLCKALHLVTYIDNALVPTLAGMLLIGKEEKIAELIPAAQYAFQVMKGNTIRVNEQVRKPMLATFEYFLTLLVPWNPEKEIVDGLFRIPIPEFDQLAFREALVNAFCHRDYYMLGMTRILINEEGLTISNPGGFIAGVTLKNLLSVEPRGRNPVLADALKRIGLAERTGRGIDQIFTGSIIYGRPLPDYSESNEYGVQVFIPRALPDIPFAKMIRDEQSRTGISFSIQALLVLSILRIHRRLTMSALAEHMNFTESRVKSAVHFLIDRGFVEAIGQGRGRMYMLSASVYKRTDASLTYVRQADIDRIRYPEMIMKYIQTQGSISRIETSELLHVSPMQAYRLLKKLCEIGRIEKIGRTKKAKYILKNKES